MPSASSQTPNAQRSLLILASLVLVIASLYWAQKIILPLALALMLTFLLTPAVSALQRRGLPRVPAVLLVVALALGLVVGVGWIVASQVQGLVRTMPEHKDQITAKLSDLQQSSQGVFQGLVRMSREIAEELQRTQDNPDLAGGRDRPIPVVVKARESDSLTWFPVVIGPALETLATAGLILILVIFMLINNLRIEQSCLEQGPRR